MEEQELYNKLKSRLIPDLEFSEKKYSKWDCYTSRYNLHIELKCRNKHYDELLIEKSKYDSLMLLDTGVRYICSTPQGVYSFNIKEMPVPVWIEKSLPATSSFSNRNWIPKLVGFMNISNSINITYLIR